MPVYNNRIIDIEIYYEYEYDDVASTTTTYVVHPSNIAKKHRFTDDQLDDFNDFVGSVYSVIIGRHFDVKRHWQSEGSYSYYIDFYPITSDGIRLDEITIRFRLSDHNTKSNKDRVTRTPDVYIKRITINGNRYPSSVSAVLAIKKMCEGLQKGDYSVLDVL